MSIHEMYENNLSMNEVLDIAEHNCETCVDREKCMNLHCPSIKAAMDISEKKIMDKETKKRYFNLIGG